MAVGWVSAGGWKTDGKYEWKICNDENGGENQKKRKFNTRRTRKKIGILTYFYSRFQHNYVL